MSNTAKFLEKIDPERAERLRKARTRMRDIANTLLSHPTFQDWAGDVLRDHSYFGEGRELSPYEQGRRGGVVRIFETLIEASDNGPEFLAKVFREKVMANTENNG